MAPNWFGSPVTFLFSVGALQGKTELRCRCRMSELTYHGGPIFTVLDNYDNDYTTRVIINCLEETLWYVGSRLTSSLAICFHKRLSTAAVWIPSSGAFGGEEGCVGLI